MSESEKKDMSIKENSQGELGVSFGKEKSEKEENGPGEHVYEAAERHLAPSKKNVSINEGVFNVESAFDDNGIEMGTIVSDKKHKRIPITESLKSAFTEWWGGTRKSINEVLEDVEKEEEEKVERPGNEDRTDIIKEATKNTSVPPKEDHHVVIEKTKTFNKDVEKIKGTPILAQPVPKEEKERKSEKVKVETPDLRKEMIAPSIHKSSHENIDTYKIPEVKEETESSPPKLPPIKKEKEEPEVVQNVFVAPKVTTPSSYKESEEKESKDVSPRKLEWDDEPVSQKIEKQTIEERARVTQAPMEKPDTQTSGMGDEINTTPSIPRRPNEDLPEEKGSSDLWRTILRIFIIIVIVLALVALAVYAVVKFNLFETSDTQEVQEQDELQMLQPDYLPAFFEIDERVPVYVSRNREQFTSALIEELVASDKEVTQLYPVIRSETVLQNLTTEEIFRILNTQLDQSSIRVLEDVSMFGSVKTEVNEPYFVIRSYNFDTLFAGLLDWEENMYEDLMPLFGEETATSTTFVDAIKDNSSIRVLYDENGTEVMLYAFVNRNTVVFTTSILSLSKIIDRF